MGLLIRLCQVNITAAVVTERQSLDGEAMARLMLLLLLWVGVTVSTVVDLQKRIIGGHECEPKERLYHVKLIASDGKDDFLCGGSLISDQWILTAAHCWEVGWTINAVLGVHPGPEQPVVIKAPPEIFTDYDKNNNKRSHDIMLLKLPRPTKIRPIELPNCRNPPKLDEKIQIAGHAATTGGPNKERKPSESPTLHCADIDVVKCEDLIKTLQKKFQQVYRVKVYQHWFCGQTPGVDICYGDSGGGVVYEDKIYGVISFLGDPDRVCRKAAAFMDLCNPDYATWIRKTIT